MPQLRRFITTSRVLRHVSVFTMRACTLLFTMPVAAKAQASPAASPETATWLVGGSIGIPRVEGETFGELSLVGMSLTQATPNRLGFNMSLGVAPRVLPYGVVGGALTVGGVVPLRLAPELLLLPTVGMTVAGVLGSGAADGARGWHVGAAVAQARKGRVGLRAGLSGHQFSGVGTTVWLIEIGLMKAR